jgi:uncharacterized protein YukE
MSFLDTNVAQVLSSAAGVHDASTMFASTLQQAQATATQAQAFHQGDSSMAFQQAHARFSEGAQKLQTLLMQAGMNAQGGGQEYTVGDQAGADMMNQVPIGDGGGLGIRA